MAYSNFKILIEMTVTHIQTHRALSNISNDGSVLLMLLFTEWCQWCVYYSVHFKSSVFHTAGDQSFVTLSNTVTSIFKKK